MDRLFAAEPEPLDLAGYVQVAPEQGVDLIDEGLAYAVPRPLANLRVGDRVVVPLGRGNKPVAGYVIERCDTLPARLRKLAQVKAILRRDERGLSLTPDLIQLARWMAGYYCCPLGMVLLTMLPAAVKHGTGSARRVMVRLAAAAAPQPAPADAPAGTRPRKLSALQRTVLEIASQHAVSSEPWIEIKELADAAGARTIGPVKQLVAKGLLVTQDQATVRAATYLPVDPPDAAAPTAPPQLSAEQRRAVDGVLASIDQGFGVHLLHGVTGSGKTEVYLRVIESVLKPREGLTAQPQPAQVALGETGAAIVLVPEIALTPQTVARFVARFGECVAVLHSGLTSAQRHQQWQRIRTGQARIVIGARSAIFAPLPFTASQSSAAEAPRGTGARAVLIVDEEHDPSYKQDQLPRYHGRDVAIKRAQLLGVPIILGSATPSLESYYNATDPSGRGYALHTLPERVTGLNLPHVEVVDLQAERKLRGGSGILSHRLRSAIEQTLRCGGQVMLLLNRRGYANYIACPDHRCGWLMTCDYCDVLMVYHKWRGAGDTDRAIAGLVRCHHCGAEQMLPGHCPLCGRSVITFGLGTQRLQEELTRQFPQAVCERMDADTMRTGRDYQRTLAAFRRGAIHILLGTQMIAKGLDFPNVRLVGVISADTALHMPDFRSAERTFQLVAQVAGRAGRGHEVSTVIVQTFNPAEPAITLAARHDYPTFARRELELRRHAGWPPVTRMARIVVRDRDAPKAAQRAQHLADHLRTANQELSLDVELAGPLPCPIARLAEYYRQEIQLLAPDAGRIQKLLASLRSAGLLRSDLLTAVDMDPVALL